MRGNYSECSYNVIYTEFRDFENVTSTDDLKAKGLRNFNWEFMHRNMINSRKLKGISMKHMKYSCMYLVKKNNDFGN